LLDGGVGEEEGIDDTLGVHGDNYVELVREAKKRDESGDEEGREGGGRK
jgi:hypothetical protein